MQHPDAAKLTEGYKHWGQEIPKGLVAPELRDIEFTIWEAFWELSTERQIGMSAGPIPVSKIRKHAAEVGLSQFAFKRIATAMDQAYLGHVSAMRGE